MWGDQDPVQKKKGEELRRKNFSAVQALCDGSSLESTGLKEAGDGAVVHRPELGVLALFSSFPADKEHLLGQLQVIILSDTCC